MTALLTQYRQYSMDDADFFFSGVGVYAGNYSLAARDSDASVTKSRERDQPIFEHIARTKPILLRDTFRNVMVRCAQRYVSEADVADLVQACPGIVNLNFEVTKNADLVMSEYLLDESYITGIRTLPLRRIHCDLVEIIDSSNSQPFSLLVFTHLTPPGPLPLL
jgi:hypothetical protein